MLGCYNGFFIAESVTVLSCVLLQFYFTLNTYHYDPKEFIAFSQIDQKLTDASNSEERYAYLTTFTTHKAKNRFTVEHQKKSSTKSFCKLLKLFK